MNCKEIAENYAQAAEVVKIEERGKTRLFIIICILGFALIFESAYIIYDRKKDSEFMIESTEIVQDGQGNNTYIDGVERLIKKQSRLNPPVGQYQSN